MHNITDLFGMLRFSGESQQKNVFLLMSSRQKTKVLKPIIHMEKEILDLIEAK
jgi:hypothetical protein